MIKFLSDDIWTTIKSLSDKSRKTKVAVAYFGTGAATQLTFKKGDTLLVAMTLGNVKVGQVNPFEIEKLYDKGVHIFNLPNLHSKIYLFDKTVIIGSANVSSNSADTLIETGLLTDDSKTISKTDKFIKAHCVEKVEQDYIEICKKNYNPPKFFGNGQKRILTKSKFKGQLSTTWVISTRPTEWKNADYETLETDQEVFEDKISNKRTLELYEVKYGASHLFINKVKEGDNIIEIIKHKVKAQVVQPKRALGVTLDKQRRVAFLRTEQRKKTTKKSWTTLENILHRNGFKSITKNSTREIKNDDIKKLLNDYFN
ncbi:MAG: phospholipase D family protein [Bacteroidota bacterium]|nr:phospholipase D family protein [Bacteroidota bacterium]